MKVLERLELVDRIGRELQSRMSYADIDIYLKAHNVNVKKPTSGANSKWVYVKELKPVVTAQTAEPFDDDDIPF